MKERVCFDRQAHITQRETRITVHIEGTMRSRYSLLWGRALAASDSLHTEDAVTQEKLEQRLSTLGEEHHAPGPAWEGNTLINAVITCGLIRRGLHCSPVNVSSCNPPAGQSVNDTGMCHRSGVAPSIIPWRNSAQCRSTVHGHNNVDAVVYHERNDVGGDLVCCVEISQSGLGLLRYM